MPDTSLIFALIGFDSRERDSIWLAREQERCFYLPCIEFPEQNTLGSIEGMIAQVFGNVSYRNLGIVSLEHLGGLKERWMRITIAFELGEDLDRNSLLQRCSVADVLQGHVELWSTDFDHILELACSCGVSERIDSVEFESEACQQSLVAIQVENHEIRVEAGESVEFAVQRFYLEETGSPQVSIQGVSAISVSCRDAESLGIKLRVVIADSVGRTEEAEHCCALIE